MYTREATTKDGQTLKMREGRAEDAAKVLSFNHTLSGESDYLSFGVGEYTLNEEQQAAQIEDNRFHHLGCG